MIKCIDCPYYVAEEKGYPFCCLYLMALDNVAIYDLCKFIKKEENDNSKDNNDGDTEDL